MSRSRLAPAAMAAVVMLGGGLYFTSQRSKGDGTADKSTKIDKEDLNSDNVQQRKQRADAKRDLGLGGAGVGGNAMTGGTELGSGLKSSNKDNNRATNTTASKDQLPSGGVGGGVGAGGANSRAVELSSGSSGSSTGGSVSGTLQSVFGVGGGNAGEKWYEEDPKDTKVKSHLADTPTNKGGRYYDKHRKDVTAVTGTSESPNKN